jgi:mono/diheme cytochrome c family protein
MARILFASFLSLFLLHCDGSERVHYFLDMRNSPAVDTQESDFIGNRKGNLGMPENTVAYGKMPYRLQATIDLGKVNGNVQAPAEINLEIGEKKYNIYCTPCHGLQGYADGKVSEKWAGIKKLASKDGSPVNAENYSLEETYHIITVGNGAMMGYGKQMVESDRWAIARYVKTVLQKK